jgi:hypothetical protein
MAETIYTPGIGGQPFGNANANPQASPYAQTSGYAPSTTILLDKAVSPILFNATARAFDILTILFSKPFKSYKSDEFEYLEYTFARTPIELAANVTAVAAVPGVAVQQTLTLTAASMESLDVNSIIVFPSTNDHVIVRQILPANQVLVETPTSGGIPAVNIATQTPIMPVMSSISADGRSNLTNYQRLKTITRYNFIQQFQRAVRWGRWELAKYKNLARTDYLQVDVSERMDQIRYDLFATFFNGVKGEYRLAAGELAKATDGIFPMMVNAGSANSTATTATLKPIFEALCLQTDFKAAGAPRFAVGAQKVLYELSKSYKEPGIRYAPNDAVANLNLMEYKIGEMRIVPIRCELLRETSLFPADFGNRLFVLDMETIHPCVMEGIPALESGATLEIGPNGTREGFKDWYIMAQLGVEMNNPLSSFWIDLIGI